VVNCSHKNAVLFFKVALLTVSKIFWLGSQENPEDILPELQWLAQKSGIKQAPSDPKALFCVVRSKMVQDTATKIMYAF
jgi:hypothetical protein